MMIAMAYKKSSEFNPSHQLRSEIAVAAARLIAEDGADYASAKRKAAQQLLGNRRIDSDFIPNNSQIEEEVRSYNALFLAETQPVRLLHLRKIAIEVMSELSAFCPYLTGAVCNGTAGEHSDIHLQLFVDSPKDVEIYLLNKNVQFTVSDLESDNQTEKRHRHHTGNDPAEILHFAYKNEGIHLALYESNALRGSIRPSRTHLSRSDRLDLVAARLLLEQQIGITTEQVRATLSKTNDTE
ncbi:hypothetical protein QN379_11825 [Glaciimonas sp. Gout2]|uniref:hypothetical protein n=1 Tax=unclassified Glaciimonas TaxID=2644401 RepID=UPI002B23A80C|nr:MULTISPECIES: hypothetical protein [unclassified Glaciimonas]MEB0013388.1 hypothetical protein [Glaciimonas sp. Cout2]MEB0082701.1 hypothetical protein [Glaciimonas sp. Gout2]